MRFLNSPMKLLVDVIMLFFLIGGVGNLWFLAHSDQVVPINPYDLESVQITVKSLDIVTNGNLAKLSAEEYPTKFILAFLSKPPAKLGGVIQAGQKVSVRIKKGKARELPHLYSTVTYGVTLEDGTKIFDTSQDFLSNRDRSMTSFNLANLFFYGMVAIPILYFLARILLRLRATRYSNKF